MTLGRTPAVGRSAATRSTSIADLPDLVWWVEPDSQVSGDGVNVDSWTDKSSAGNTLSETLTNRPTVLANALDGYSGVKVLSANSQRLKRANTQLFKTDLTIGLVLKVNASVADQRILDTNRAGFAVGLALAQNGTNYSWVYNGVAFVDGNAVSTTGYHILIFSSAKYANPAYRYDRADVALSGTGLITPSVSSTFILGSDSGLTNPASVTYVAGFACQRVLSPAQIAFAENDWKAKYPSLA